MIESLIAKHEELQTLNSEMLLKIGGRQGLAQTVVNHFYWACDRTREDGTDCVHDLMIRFIEGLVHHLQDCHEFCEHNHNKLEYTPLRRGGLAARDLEEGHREFALANKMCFFTRCRESACVEGLHRLNIKYACKTFFFGLSFIIRVLGHTSSAMPRLDSRT
jgi:hypothetical protein